MSARPIVYFCVDIEASGTVPGLFSMLSLGAVEVKAFIRDRLTAGLSEADVIESVAQTFEARQTQQSLSATSAASTIQ